MTNQEPGTVAGDWRALQPPALTSADTAGVAAPPAKRTRLVIEPGRAAKNYWRDLWRYRELLYFLAWRDIVVRYKQTAIGVAWALIRPALTMVVFVAFRRLAGIAAGRGARADPGVRRGPAVAVLLDRAHGSVGQPDRQRQPDLEGLLPAADHSRRRGGHGVGRLR